MTTTLTLTSTQTATELLAKLQHARAKLLDPMDYPGQWTQRQRNTYDTLRARAAAYVQDLTQTLAVLEASTARLADWQPVRERLQAVEAKLVEQLNASPKSEELRASLVTLRRGGITRDGERIFGMPRPLEALLTDTCPHCGHRTVAWDGPLGVLDEEIRELEKSIGHATVRLTNYLLPDVEAWLALVTPAAAPEGV
jgi:hypothetical protein